MKIPLGNLTHLQGVIVVEINYPTNVKCPAMLLVVCDDITKFLETLNI